MIRLYRIDSMMHSHLVGIYDTTTIVQFECQARGDLSQNTLPSSSSSSSELKQSILVLDTLPISQVKNAPGIYPSFSSSFFDPLSTIHGKTGGRGCRVIRGVSISKDNSYLGLPTKKAIVKEENGRFTAFVLTPYSSVLLLFFFPSVHTRKIFQKDCLQHIWHCSSWICKSHLYISLCCRYP